MYVHDCDVGSILPAISNHKNVLSILLRSLPLRLFRSGSSHSRERLLYAHNQSLGTRKVRGLSSAVKYYLSAIVYNDFVAVWLLLNKGHADKYKQQKTYVNIVRHGMTVLGWLLFVRR